MIGYWHVGYSLEMAAYYNKAFLSFWRIPFVLMIGLLLLHTIIRRKNIPKTLLGLNRQSSLNEDQQNIIRRNILQKEWLVENTTPPVCVKKKNIIFVKVHKTGSTTTWGIFARFSQNHNLNMVLPKQERGAHFNYLSTSRKTLKDSIIPLPVNVSYNILCNHAIYNKTEFEDIMPRDTVKFGILRNPLSVSKSAYFYFGYFKDSQRRHPDIEERLLLQSFIRENRVVFPWYSRTIFNGMSYDFGIDPFQISNISYIEQYIQQLNKDFKLIIISEWFDESLVLMKRYLCWDLKDILYLPVNRGDWRSRSIPLLTDDDKLEIMRLNTADSLLYEFFKERLKNQIENEDETFKHEVRHFKDIISNLQEFCRETDRTVHVSYKVEKSNWNPEFIVDINVCSKLRMSELATLRHMIRRAKAQYF